MLTLPIKLSLRRDYVVFSSILIVVTLILCASVIGITYRSQALERRFYYGHYSDLIDRALMQALDYIANSLEFVGSNIADTKGDRHTIADILSKHSTNQKLQNLLSWTVYDWIPPDNRITINSTQGVLEKPVQSDRPHLKETARSPGKLFFSDVNIGLVSKQKVIPAGMGIKDHQNRFIGTLNIGISVDDLIDQIERGLDNTVVSFAIVNRNTLALVAESSNNISIDESTFYFLDLGTALKSNSNTGFLAKPILHGNVEYRYYQTVAKYPFVILLGINQQLAHSQFMDNVVPRIAEIALLMIFMMALLFYFRRRIVQPIVTLSETANRMVTEPDVIIPKGEYYEIGILSEKLNEIQIAKKQLIELRHQESQARREAENARERLRIFNEELEERVRQRTAELERSLQVKTEFLNNLSHELRIPVHGVCSYLESLADYWAVIPEEERHSLVKKIYSNSQRLHHLIDELLDLAKFTANKMTYSFASYDLYALTQEAIQESSALAFNKPIELKLEEKSGDTTAIFDRDKIYRVLINLYSNAIKFSPKGTIIATISEGTVEVENKKVNALIFALKDEGIGVPHNELMEIFMPFSQGSHTKTGSGGTGLGLSICKEIIRGHGGKIWVENNKEGSGATFKFSIPLTQKL